MQVSDIIPVILCGGSGTRLWPLSRQALPKQFAPLLGAKSLLQLTLERVARLNRDVVCVAAEDHRFLVAQAMKDAQVGGAIILEPAARNTAPAMALAALNAIENGRPDSLLLFCPADHHIPDAEAFARMAAQGREAAAGGAIVTFGVVPHIPNTAYGYIKQGAPLGKTGGYKVEKFVEKPQPDAAQKMLLDGGYLWNAGIFLVRAGVLAAALERHVPDILAACAKAMQGCSRDGIFIRPQAEAFRNCRAESIDYAVLEHHAGIAVVPFNGRWSDVGSWNAVADLADAQKDGNRSGGNPAHAHHLHSRNTYIHASERPVVALGTEDLLIIDTPDALLVASRDHAEKVKDVVIALGNRQVDQAVHHRKVARPWGCYDSIDAGPRFQVKRITVNPGAALSLQRHNHRAEHWVVVTGAAKVTCGDKTFLLRENESTYIPVGEIHRLENPGDTPLEMIEVQSGDYLGEDDIVRLEDAYGRHK